MKTEEHNLQIVNIPLKNLKDNPYQPRKKYPVSQIKKLAKNINERGLMQPISVVEIVETKTVEKKRRGRRPLNADTPTTKTVTVTEKRYILVAGHRRTRAIRRLRWKTIPAIIRKQSTKEDLAIDLAVENAMRKDFNPLEKSQAIFQVLKTIKAVDDDIFKAYSLVTQTHLWRDRKLIPANKRDKTFTVDDFIQCKKLLETINCSETSATEYLKLLDLPHQLQNKIVASLNQQDSAKLQKKGYMTVGQAYELSRLKDNKLRIKLYEAMIENGWKGQLLRHIVNELLEHGAEMNNHKGLGTSKIRRDKDEIMNTLTNSCTNLASKLKNAEYHIVRPLDYSVEKAALRASLTRLREEAIILATTANNVLSIDDGLEEASANLNIKLRPLKDGVRFTFPQATIKTVKGKPGDIVQMKISGIIRSKTEEKYEDDPEYEEVLKGLMA